MKKFLLCITGALLTLTLSANTSMSDGKIATFDNSVFKTTLGEKHQWKSGEFVKPAHSKINAHSDLTLGPTGGYSILLGPDNSQWYATQTYEVSGSYYTASTITLYNSKGEKQGEINVTIPEDTKVNQILVGDIVSSNLFDKVKTTYEIPVILHNIISSGVTSYTTHVYDIASGELKISYDGFMSVIDYSTGYSTEWVGVLSNDTTINDTAMAKYDIYSKPGWTTQTAELKKSFTLPKKLAEYQVGSPLNVYEIDNSLYYVVSQYEKEYLDPASYQEPWDMIPTADNNFVATIYNKNFVEMGKVSIPVTSTKQVLVQYGVGLFGFNDLSKNYWSNVGGLELVVTSTSFNVTNEDENINFDVYDLKNQKVKSIASGMSNWMYMYDIPGQPTQMAFLSSDGSQLSMIDLPECATVTTFGAQIEGEAISNNIDRYPVGDSYQYVIALASPEKDAQNNFIQRFAWVTKEGSISRQVKFNLGQSNASWIPLVMGETLNPFAFDTDDKHEYVFIANQYANGTTGAIVDELRIMKEDGSLVRSYKEDASTKGELGTCNLLGLNGECPSLIVPYLNSETNQFTIEIDFLPLEKFSAGGEGTAEKPYLITSAGDLAMISREPAAHYKVVNNFSAASYGTWNALPSFTGTLDGGNYTISDLSFNGNEENAGIFASTEGSKIKNLVIEAPSITINSTSAAGIIAANTMGDTISNVRVNNAVIAYAGDATPSVGGIVGNASLNTYITNCYVDNIEIDINGSNVGGIAGSLRTASCVNNCAASGTIKATDNIGGIAGSASTDCAISNCHVNATISGQNTIGGITGSAERGGIHLCYVEGSIEATEADWGGNFRVGGIAGSLSTDWAATGEDNAEDKWNGKVISNNVIALSSIKSGAKAAHRVVGYTRWDEDIEATQWDPSIVPMAEPCLDKNYVLSSLSAIDNAIEAIATTTEGATIEAAALNKEFFEGLGFIFGNNATNPWVEANENWHLYFEIGASDGVESIVNEKLEINYANGIINAGDAVAIDIYNLGGVKIASGASTIDASNLQKGIYVVVATNATGAKKTTKIAVK